MQAPTTTLRRDLVLVGGGHAHALALRMLAMRALPPELRITLISPASHTPYSGMLPGMIAGHYTFESTHIDLIRLCEWAGVRFIPATASGLDPQARQVLFTDRPPLGYDVVSLDIGSQPEVSVVPGAREHAIPVKPVSSFLARWKAFVASLGNLAGASVVPKEVAVVGGGAGGVEIVLAMAHALRDREIRWSLYPGRAGVLLGYNATARKAAREALAAYGIAVHAGVRVARVEARQLTLDDGSTHAADSVFWCTAASAAGWVSDCGLETDERGFLVIRDTLQSVGDPRVFAAGDIATQVNFPRPKAGVYAVRQAPVLADNLLRAVMSSGDAMELHEHKPQQKFLSLVSLGDRKAVANKGLLGVEGAWVWRWKHHIDSAFMQKFSDLKPLDMAATKAAVNEQMPCGGCGAKIGGDPLRQALMTLRERYPQWALPQGVESEDAVRLPIPEGGLVMQSIDSLRAMVRDPFLQGRIAAQHSLSDVYAVGAIPTSVQAHVVLPFASPSLQQRDLEQVLGGMLEVLSEASCPLIGGHSLQGPELQLGLVVNAQMHQGVAPRSKCAVDVGDHLILTKPLGSGVLFAAQMQLCADGRDIAAAVESMGRSNALASRIAQDFGVRAATDVTGFGLLGHLAEMLPAGIGAELDSRSIPLLPGALLAAAAGIRSSLWEANRNAVQCRLHIESSAQADLGDDPTALLCDPQTSGGLLLAVPAEKAAECLAALQQSGVRVAEIGRVVAQAEGQIRVR